MKDLASKLRKKITIEQASTSLDPDSFSETNWQPVYNLRANVCAINEFHYNNQVVWVAAQPFSKSYYLFTVRYKPNINHQMRISYQGRLYAIEKIINIEERNIATQIIAKEDKL